ncbi:hypothetical protein AN2635.2 [Aspergillus nidulans FGSC A4]|uniref:Integrase catalytic domain-containing protein n=1 Tax=Emericella nidulans (strain FGSC A4 / ATCC 38163 / CBS 112.46 / NRRL 194 / M139) TaxID=227321 RepID=Q5B9Z5_EMENI|nr:hypothetical protein [Aspergillus nidulans FGSC A4]EAA62982.1 hypothetical protein AN2635.2 [Aspergillus nidulans FGSC A4]CBF84313.1 TPA: hypothetical protein ANIA_02635 [Aspergillus nidulans FGSC A4]|eukprot:XP_660239.1 hypothetical protein AN2635.2 [Aspergillus nidulans FGSC A4]
MDFWGPYSKAKTLERYYLSLTDDCTRFSWIYLTKDREAATVKATLEQWLALAEREKGVKLLIIRTDNAREFKALEPWALKKGIQIEFTEPDTPQQNSMAERLNQYLLEMTRAILIDADVPKEYWPVPEASSGTRGGIIEALGANNTGDRDDSIDTAGTGGIGGAGGAEDDAGDNAEDNTGNIKNNSKQTEAIYGQKPRAQRHREEREVLKDPSLHLSVEQQ